MILLLVAQNYTSLNLLFLGADPQDHAVLKVLKVPVVNADPQDLAAHKVPVVNAAHKVYQVPVVNAALQDHAAHKVHVVNAVLQDHAAHVAQEASVVNAEPLDSAALWVTLVVLDQLVLKVLLECLALPELLVCKAHKVQKVIQVYKDLEARLVPQVHAGKLGQLDLKVYVDHKAFQVSKDPEVNQVAKGNVAVLVHAAHVAHADHVVHVAHVVPVFVLL
jgi:hypothetical protein